MGAIGTDAIQTSERDDPDEREDDRGYCRPWMNSNPEDQLTEGLTS